MLWQSILDLVILEVISFQNHLSTMVNEKLSPQLKNQARNLKKNKTFYKFVNFFAKHFLLAVLFFSFASLILVFYIENPVILSTVIIVTFLILLELLKLNWNRNQKIKDFYVKFAELIEKQNPEKQPQIVTDDRFEYMTRSKDDLINIKNIINFISNDSRLKNQIRTKWYQFWLPETISFLNEYYGYPEVVVETRLDFIQKLYDKVLISVILGLGFFIFNTIPILSGSEQILTKFIILLIVFVFMSLSLVIISYYLLRYPTYKKELLIWLKVHDYHIHLSTNDPKKLLDEDDVEEGILEELEVQ